MVHEKRGSKEDSGDSGSKEPKKCKSHLLKETYNLARKKKWEEVGERCVWVCLGLSLHALVPVHVLILCRQQIAILIPFARKLGGKPVTRSSTRSPFRRGAAPPRLDDRRSRPVALAGTLGLLGLLLGLVKREGCISTQHLVYFV